MLRYGVEMRDKAIWYLSQGRTELVGLHSQDRISSLFRISHRLPCQKASVTEVKSYLEQLFLQNYIYLSDLLKDD